LLGGRALIGEQATFGYLSPVVAIGSYVLAIGPHVVQLGAEKVNLRLQQTDNFAVFGG